jgi:putative membrane protein
MMRHQIIAVAIGAAALLAGPVAAQVPSAAQLQNPELEKNLKPGANSFMESQARELLEQQGYSNVSSMMNDKNGIWHGKAIKNDKTFDVSVDYQGKIAAK